jgi:hypothetical protein
VKGQALNGLGLSVGPLRNRSAARTQKGMVLMIRQASCPYCSAQKDFAAKINNFWHSRKIFWRFENALGRPQTLQNQKTKQKGLILQDVGAQPGRWGAVVSLWLV